MVQAITKSNIFNRRIIHFHMGRIHGENPWHNALAAIVHCWQTPFNPSLVYHQPSIRMDHLPIIRNRHRHDLGESSDTQTDLGGLARQC